MSRKYMGFEVLTDKIIEDRKSVASALGGSQDEADARCMLRISTGARNRAIQHELQGKTIAINSCPPGMIMPIFTAERPRRKVSGYEWKSLMNPVGQEFTVVDVVAMDELDESTMPMFMEALTVDSPNKDETLDIDPIGAMIIVDAAEILHRQFYRIQPHSKSVRAPKNDSYNDLLDNEAWPSRMDHQPRGIIHIPTASIRIVNPNRVY